MVRHFAHIFMTLTHLAVAPEFRNQQLAGQDGGFIFDERCEMYSFGFVLQSLLLGKLPRRFDRPNVATFLLQNPDPQAGVWPEAVVKTLAETAVRCLEPSAARQNRPSIDRALDTLLELQANHPLELTKEQSDTIRQSVLHSSPSKAVS